MSREKNSVFGAIQVDWVRWRVYPERTWHFKRLTITRVNQPQVGTRDLHSTWPQVGFSKGWVVLGGVAVVELST